uniref:Zonadhesin-like n=1 Tax=Saccoglossus kowalevskii TaxID=10224 RepID=A0ABM0M6P2_SACKO|nr:PREDICTED: zonadhesin-like [Saccoglossus kowalevskii]
MLRLMYITLALVAASELSIQEDPYNRACDENEVSFKGHCYMFSTDKETGLRATTICERLGSALVTISSKEEFEFLKNTITGDSRLNGMNYLTGARKIRKKWRWLSGGKIGSCWAPGKPEIRRNRNCACMSPSHNYDMINLKCAQLQRYICEKEFSALSRDQIPKGGCMCMVRGDPHYMTCDGKRHNFQGNCTYTTFLDQLHSNQPYFKVMAKNEHNPQNSRKVTYQKTITVELFHPDFKTSHSVVLFRNHTIYLDGVSVTPPSNPEEGLIISYFGRHILLETSFGFWVTWDFRHRTEMRAPPEYENNIGGMCGNCDGNPDNDYFSPDGSLAKSSKEYGNSWKTSISCPDVYEEEQECDNDIQNLYTGSDQCGLIKDTTGPFAECIAELDSETVDGFFKDCIYDMCYIGGNDTLCDSIESMYDECMYIGVQVSTFRTTTFCPLDCPNNSRYTPSASPCEKTCVEPSAADFCPELNTEMCECIDGYVRSGVDCVRSTDCGCRGADNIYRLRGETWKNSNCTETCTCTEGGIVCEEVICDVNSLCSPVDGVYTCVCSPGYSGDGITCTYLCSTSHFGGYCYPDCQESMVALENAAFCESRKCCKPRHYNPDPVEVNGVTITPAMLEKNSSQTRPVLGIDSSKTRPDTGTDEYVLFGTTYGGI